MFKNVAESNLFIVIFTDVEITVINLQNACAGAGSFGIYAESVSCTIVFGVPDYGSPTPTAILRFITANKCEGLHCVFIGHVIGSTGADGHVKLAVKFNNFPNGTAVNAVRKMIGGIIKQILLVCNNGEAFPRVGG